MFVTAAALFGTLGSAITVHERLLQIVLGAVTIVVGVGFLRFIPALQRERKTHSRSGPGLIGAPLLGFGWLPCLTRTLTAVYLLAAVEGTAGRGAVLSVAYCIGLGIPFMLVAWGRAG